MVIRTKSEEKCQDCGSIINAYDVMMGRLCPKCTAQRCAFFGRNLERWSHPWSPTNKFGLQEDADISYLAESNKHLLVEPLIDHSNDIDKNIKENKNK